MHRTRRLVTAFVAAIALTIVVTTFAAAPTASADPICGAPGAPPCAGPSPLSPEQQCAFIAWRSMMPCNWLGSAGARRHAGELGQPAGTAPTAAVRRDSPKPVRGVGFPAWWSATVRPLSSPPSRG